MNRRSKRTVLMLIVDTILHPVMMTFWLLFFAFGIWRAVGRGDLLTSSLYSAYFGSVATVFVMVLADAHKERKKEREKLLRDIEEAFRTRNEDILLRKTSAGRSSENDLPPSSLH